MDYLDSERFKNHEGMRKELIDAGCSDLIDMLSEAELIHLYDITFLVGRYDLVQESRRYRPSGTRMSSGPFKGEFPPTHKHK